MQIGADKNWRRSRQGEESREGDESSIDPADTATAALLLQLLQPAATSDALADTSTTVYYPPVPVKENPRASAKDFLDNAQGLKFSFCSSSVPF